MNALLRKVSCAILGLFFLATGVMHFVDPETFVAIVPHYLPGALLLVYISGVFEILGGVGLWIPFSRSAAGWGLLALLVAVFPANIYMLTDHPHFRGEEVSSLALWLRLPLQFVLMAWTWWASRPASPSRTP